MTSLQALRPRPPPALATPGEPGSTPAGATAGAAAPPPGVAAAGGETALHVKADVAAVLQQVLDLVLGGIPDDETRKEPCWRRPKAEPLSRLVPTGD